MMTKNSATIALLVSTFTTGIAAASGISSPAAAGETTSNRSLSSISYSYNDGLTICVCNAINDCLDHASLEDISEVNLCFLTDISDDAVVEELVDLTFSVPGQDQQQDIIQGSILLPDEAAIHYQLHSCAVSAPLAFDFSQDQPGVLIARGSILLRDSGDEEPRDIQFVQILKMKEDVPEIPPPQPPNRPEGSKEPGNGKEDPNKTSGYAMITGVVILLPGMWGAAVYAYHKIFRKSDDEDDEHAADVLEAEENEARERNHGDLEQPISIVKVEDAVAAVDRMMVVGDEGGEWETISDL